MIKYRKTKKKN